jgi:hypothetical protein
LDYARASDVCIADAGEDCSDPHYQAKDFGTVNPIAFTFRVAGGALPKGYKITSVAHGGPPVPEGHCDATGFCVVSIVFDPKKKEWTLLVTSPTNGHFSW